MEEREREGGLVKKGKRRKRTIKCWGNATEEVEREKKEWKRMKEEERLKKRG